MLILQDGYLVTVPTEGAATIRIVQTFGDSLPPLRPTSVLRVDDEIESANLPTRLIDGSMAIRLVGDENLAAGRLTLMFTDDASLAAARAFFALRAVYELDHPGRPTLNMRFVREGVLRPGMHDQARNVWQVEVGFREVAP